jgi:hypothetical protein
MKKLAAFKIIGHEGGINSTEPFLLVKWFKLLFKNEEYVKEQGFEINADNVTTNNVAAYFEHARDNISRKSYQYFWFNFFWGFLMGGFVYFLCAYGNEGVLDENGSPNDSWGIGVTLIYSLIAAHNALFWIEIRSFNTWTIFACCVSIITFMPLTINMNNGLSLTRGPYYKNQWTDVFNHPKLHFIVLINAFICVFPRYLWHFVEHSLVWPEFARVKSR